MKTTIKNLIFGFTATSFCAHTTLSIFSQIAFADPYEDAIEAKVRQDYTTAYDLFSPLANSGNAEAQFEIALLYLNGNFGVKSQQKPTGVMWLRQAANGGHLQAQKEMVVLWILAGDYGVSDEEMEKYERMAAEQGDADSQYSVGHSYSYERNYRAARNWLEKAASQSHDAAAKELKELPAASDKQFTFQDANDAANRGDEIAAFKIYKTLADEGNVDASYWTGYAFEYARGTVQSYGDSIKYYTIAAEKGSKDAQSKLGVIYLNGTVVAQNKNIAIFWLKKAQAQGDIIAKLKLSELKIPYTVPLHSNSDDIKKIGTRDQRSKSETDLSMALKIYKNAKQKVASEASNVQALKQKLAGLRKKSKDAEKTLNSLNKVLFQTAIFDFRKGRIKKAISTWEGLASKGHYDSQLAVGLIFIDGKFIEQDIVKASLYLTSASDNPYTNNFSSIEKKNLADTQAALAKVYAEGHGVGNSRSKEQAIYWYKKAADGGNESAKKQLERLER